MCCCSWLWDCIYATRCVWLKLYVPSLIADLGLTTYIIYQLYVLDVFACCVDNQTSNQNHECAYNHIGGASNVGVNDYGFCYRKDNPSFNCGGNLTSCASSVGADITELCSPSTLKQVANTSVDWLIYILLIKAVGVVFCIFLELKAAWCDKKDAGSEEAEKSKNCCRQRSKNCLIGLSVLIIRIFFLICGTAITFIALCLLTYSNSVTFSSCRTLSSSLESQCNSVEASCTRGSDQNYYNIVFSNLNLVGPYWADVATSVLSGIIWIARLSIMRKYVNKTRLIEV